MNVLFLHTIGKNRFGGGEQWVVNTARGLIKNGHEAVVAGLPRSILLNTAKENGTPCVEMNFFSDINPLHILALRRYLNKNPTDVIITRVTDLFIAGTAARMVSENGKRPLVVVRHGLALRYQVRKHILLHNKLADGIITNAKSIKDTYEKRGYFASGFTTLIHNGTEIPGNVAPYNFDSLFPGKRIVLSAGRLARQKGFEHLIDAITLLPERHADVVFYVLGTGKRLRSLQRRAEQKNIAHRIWFPGFRKDIKPYLAGCDLFVLPSLYEGMPNAAMEAMAMGKPVLATDVNGTSELIKNLSTGMLVPPGQPEALAKAITTLMDNPTLRQKLGNAAAKHISMGFTTDMHLQNLLRYLSEKTNDKSKKS